MRKLLKIKEESHPHHAMRREATRSRWIPSQVLHYKSKGHIGCFNHSKKMLPTKFSLGIVAHILVMVCFMAIGLTECATIVKRSQYRPKRTAVISLPATALGVRWTQQVIVPVLAMINQTNTYLWFDFQMYTRIPTANNLTKLYTSFGRSMDNSDGNYIDEDFLEDQIANQERKTIYQYMESFFNK